MVSAMTTAVRDSHTAFKAFYESVHSNCESATQMMDEFIKKLKGDEITISTGINNAKDGIVEAENSIEKNEKEIKVAKEDVRKAQMHHQKEREAFDHDMTNAEAKLITIRHLKNIIRDELINEQHDKNHQKDHKDNSKKGSFLQLTTVTEKLTELKELLTKSSDNGFSMIITSLLESLTEQNFSDQGVLRKILKTLTKISDSVKEWMKKSQADREKLDAIFKKEMASKLAQMRSLGKLLVEGRSLKTNNEKTIQELTLHSSGLDATLKRKERERSYFTKECDSQNKIIKEIETSFEDKEAYLKKVAVALLNLK